MYILGVQLEGPTLNIALIKNEKGKIAIEAMRSFASNVKPLYILSELIGEKKCIFVTGLEAWEMLLRKLHLKLKSKRAIAAVLPFQIETLFPHPLEEMLVLPILSSQEEKSSELTLFAATHSELKKHLERMLLLDCDPDMISCTPIALARAAEFLHPDRNTLTLLHCGWEKTTLCSINCGKLMLAQAFPIGKQNFVAAHERDHSDKNLQDLDLSTVDRKYHPELSLVIEQFEKQVERSAVFLQSKNAFCPDLFLTGWSTTRSLFQKKEDASFQLLPATPLENAAIPLGLALDAAKNDRFSLQFRRGPFRALQEKKKQKKMVLHYLVFSSLLVAVIGIGSFLSLVKKEHFLQQKIENAMGEKCQQKLEDMLALWEKRLSNESATARFLPNIANVSDLLAWASTHPILSRGEIEIKRLRYALTSYPQVGIKMEPYRAKVEIEFIATSPRAARELYDALLQGDALVNSKQEITWNASQNSYFTTFFVKGGGP